MLREAHNFSIMFNLLRYIRVNKHTDKLYIPIILLVSYAYSNTRAQFV